MAETTSRSPHMADQPWKPYTPEQLDAVELQLRENPHPALTVVRRLLATARAGIADRERLDQLEAMIENMDAHAYDYDEEAKLWRGADGKTYPTLRAVIDAASGRTHSKLAPSVAHDSKENGNG